MNACAGRAPSLHRAQASWAALAAALRATAMASGAPATATSAGDGPSPPASQLDTADRAALAAAARRLASTALALASKVAAAPLPADRPHAVAVGLLVWLRHSYCHRCNCSCSVTRLSCPCFMPLTRHARVLQALAGALEALRSAAAVSPELRGLVARQLDPTAQVLAALRDGQAAAPAPNQSAAAPAPSAAPVASAAARGATQSGGSRGGDETSPASVVGAQWALLDAATALAADLPAAGAKPAGSAGLGPGLRARREGGWMDLPLPNVTSEAARAVLVAAASALGEWF
jgi:hypothetical protein